jgi:tripartite-type tricarboxylate transporter receptor subunit TctC
MARNRKRLLRLMAIGGLFAVALAPLGVAWAADYPNKEITMYIGSPPGGSLDISGRVISKALGEILGQPVVVVNKPGGVQSVAVSYVANTKPDGYTLIYLLNPYVTMKKLQEPDLPYSVDSFAWLGSTYVFNFMLTVREDAPWDTYEDFIAHVKKEEVVFGSDGAGGSQHIMQLKFAEMVGFKKNYTHVPFAGGGPAVRALLGKNVEAVTISPGPTGPYVKSGDLKWLLYFAPERNKVYPEVPSSKEKGLELYGGGWTAFAAPKGIPAEVATKLTKAIKESAKSKEVEAVFHKMGWEYAYEPPEGCVRMWKEDAGMFGEEMRKLGVIK